MAQRYDVILSQASTETTDAAAEHAAAIAFLRGICDPQAVEVLAAIESTEQTMTRQTNQAMAAQAAVLGLMERQEKLEAKLHEAYAAVEEAKRLGVARGSRKSYQDGERDGYLSAAADYDAQIKDLKRQIEVVTETLDLMGVKVS